MPIQYKMSTYISLTYGPDRDKDILPSINDFENLIKSMKQVQEYYIGAESAGKEKPNHYQCWIHASARCDNFRDAFIKKMKVLNPEDTDYKHSTVCNKYKPDAIESGIGYCAKEKGEFRTNLKDHQIKTGIHAWEIREVVKTKAKKECCSLGIDQIFRMLVEEHKQKKFKRFDEGLFKGFLRAYSSEISYSTRNKLRLETLSYHVNVELEED